MAALLLAGWGGGRAATPGPGAVIDTCRYPTDAAASAAWTPMPGSLPATAGAVQGAPALRLPCHFAGGAERASWDRKVDLDLSGCRGVDLEVFCRDPAPVSYFSIYFQSGDGWYQASFFPDSPTGWNRITIDKAQARAEGNPAGWRRIRTLRLSAWRGGSLDTEFFVRDLRKTGVLGEDAAVAVVRGDSAARREPAEARSVELYAQTVAANLEAAGVGCALVSDLDLTDALLRGAQVVILPHNPDFPEAATAALIRYLEHGGKVIAFYVVPDKLRWVLGLAAGSHVPQAYPGQFASIRFGANALPGAPPRVNQQSWNINAYRPAGPGARVVAEWYDANGRDTGYPALLGSARGLVMTHVLTAEDPRGKQRLLLAMVGSLAPDLWRQEVRRRLAHLGTIGGFTGFEQAAAGLVGLKPAEPRVGAAVASARTLRAEALRLAGEQHFPAAMDAVTAADQQLQTAYCLGQHSAPGEFRAVWCHNAFGVEGWDWDTAIRQLAANGFTAIFANVLWGGVAFYPSQVLPVAPAVVQRGDALAQCLAACRKYGVQCHVWKVDWNLGQGAPRALVERLRGAGRLQANARGQEEPWLCPSNPENRQLELDALIEVVRNYAVDGIHFDYIRYPDAEHCFCPGCRARFEQATGARVGRWPADVLAGGSLQARWLEWRRGNITALVRAVSARARALRPGLKISAAVFRNWSTDRDSVGQDWKGWCEQGYVDFVCPMDYTSSAGNFASLVAQQVQWAGRTPCYPGIGVSAVTPRLSPEGVIEQINVARRYHTGGFVLFSYDATTAQDLLPALGLGITAPR